MLIFFPAIALSLKEPEKSAPKSAPQQSLYPNFAQSSATVSSTSPSFKEMRKVNIFLDKITIFSSMIDI